MTASTFDQLMTPTLDDVPVPEPLLLGAGSSLYGSAVPEEDEGHEDGGGRREGSASLSPELRREFELLDSDGNGMVDFLELATGVVLVSEGTVAGKVAALVRLFDFDEAGGLAQEQMVLLVRTAVTVMLKFTGALETRPTAEELKEVALTAIKAMGVGKGERVHGRQLKRWVRATPQALDLVSRFSNGLQKQETSPSASGSAAQQRAQQQSQRRSTAKRQSRRSTRVQKSEKLRIRTEGTPSQQRRRRGSLTTPHALLPTPSTSTMADDEHSGEFGASIYNMEEIRAIKSIFDKIDRDRSGTIDAFELGRSLTENVFLQDAAAVFDSMDVDNSGEISFDEMLRVLYPLAKESEYAMMAATVENPPVTQAMVDKLTRIFEAVDHNFTAEVVFVDLLDALRRTGDPECQRWVERRVGHLTRTSVATMSEVLQELFGKTHAHEMHTILSFERPVRALLPAEKKELSELFDIFDVDRDGSLNSSEVADILQSFGMSQAEVKETFAQFDRDHDDSVDLQEFMHFYRAVWNTTTSYDPNSLAFKVADRKTRKRT